MPTGPAQPSFATVLTSARLAGQLSQEILAEHSWLSIRAIGNLDSVRRAQPRRRSAERLATALGLTGRSAAAFLRAAGLAPDPEVGGVAGTLCTLPPASAVLVGRESDLAAIASCAAGPGLVVVSGQPGVGKT